MRKLPVKCRLGLSGEPGAVPKTLMQLFAGLLLEVSEVGLLSDIA
jgi:hypothetical protein